MAYSTQPSIRYSNELFKEDMLTLSTGIVWKNRTAAIAAETTDTQELYRIELFVVANRGMLNWDVIRAFPRIVILNSGLDRNFLEMYATDKDAIPPDYRQAIVDEYARALTSKNPLTGRYAYYSKATDEWVTVYEETNNYYRMLMGLPDYGASDDTYVYNTDPRWPTDIPVHEMEMLDRIDLEKSGVLQDLINANPDKTYLKYIGKRSVDFFKARIADRFEMLWREDSQTASLNHDFDDVYEKSRQLFMAVYYNEALRQANNLYDPFMAMAILFMTIQQMQSYYLHTDITRDFYDLESLKVLYDAYSVPFYPEIPFEYHKKVVKNINRLISYKGSSQIFFDLFQIFDLGTMNIYHYYLTKRHKVDENNKPLYRFLYDEDGNVKLDENNRPIYDPSVYEMKFSKVLIGDDPALRIDDRSNDVDYNLLTVPDPYWIEDLDLITKLQNAKFNYLETKYIGVQAIFDLMSITFENAYVFRMITDNRDLCEAMEFRWTDLGINCSLFDLFIYLAALYCRLYNYEGLITNRIPALMDTYGYNFEESREILRNQVLTDPYLSQRQDLIDLMMDMDMETVDQANKVYDNITEIRDIIMKGYQKAKTKEEFFAYRNLFETLMASREITHVYTNPRTGELFETFTDVLANCSPDLMQRYLLTEDDNILNEMNICIDKLEETLTSMRWLPFSAGVNSSKMIDSLFRLLKFFKSAKAELIGYDITYAITLRGTNFFKMLDLIDRVFNQYWDKDKNTFMDFIELAHELTIAKYDAFKQLDVVANDHETVWWWDYIKYLTDCIWMIHDIIETIFSSEQWYIDFVQAVTTTTMMKSRQLMEDCTMAEEITWDIFEPKYFGLIKDEIKYLVDRIRDGEHVSYCLSLLYNIDFVHSIYTALYLQKDARFRSSLKYSDQVTKDQWHYHLDNDKHLFEDVYEVTRTIYKAYDIQRNEDFLEGTHLMEGFDTISLKDRLARIIAAWKVNDKLISLTDLLKLIILTARHHDMHELTDKIFAKVSAQSTTDAWYVDVIEEIRNYTKFIDGHLFDDHMQVETIFYEIFYPHFTERLDDDIMTFYDKLKDVSYENNCKIQMMDLLYLLDDIASEHVIIKLEDTGIRGYAINYDGLKLKQTQHVIDSNMLFGEFLEVLKAINKPTDDHTFSDALIGEISGKLDDEHLMADSMSRLIATYLVDDNLNLNDLMRVILSIWSVKDKQKLADTLIGKLTEYSDQDDTVLADVINDTIFRFGHIYEVHGFDDFAKTERIFYEEIGEDLNAVVHDRINKLIDELIELPTSDRNRVRVIDTMVLVNGLSRILSVHEENHTQMYSTIEFSDRVRLDLRNRLESHAKDLMPTLKDMITFFDTKYKESKDTMITFDDIWLKSSCYGFSENEVRDHLINILAILRLCDEYNAKDALQKVIALTRIKESPAAMDTLMRSFITTYQLSSEAKPADFMKAISSVARVSSLGLADDHLRAETVFFEELEIEETEVESIRDCIYELSDDLTSIDLNAMLTREIIALVDCMSEAAFDVPLVDISRSYDNIRQLHMMSSLKDTKSFGDIINVIKETNGLHSSFNQYDELIEKYHFDLSSNYTAKDLLAYIKAVSWFNKDPEYLKDMLTILYTASTTTDYHKIVDDIVQHLDGNLSSRAIQLDLLKNSKFRTMLNDIALMEDRVYAESIFFDDLEEEDSEYIEDKMNQLIDKMKDAEGTVYFMRESTILHMLDGIFSGRIVINQKSQWFSSFLEADDVLIEKGGTSKAHSDHFIQDVIDRAHEILGESETMRNIDILITMEKCVYSDKARFKDQISRIAAASYYYDKQLYNDLLTFFKICSTISDSSIFMDYLKEQLSSTMVDLTAPSDLLKAIQTVSQFTDKHLFQEGVIAESVIFDDYEPDELEFIEDTIRHLTDKFSELSRHECRVILENDAINALDYMINKRSVSKPRSVMEYTDTLQPRNSLSRAEEIVKMWEILAETAKSYRANDINFYNDLLKQTYLHHPVDSLPYNDTIVEMVADSLRDADEMIDTTEARSYGIQREDTETINDKTWGYYIAYGEQDLHRIISQIRRIINIKFLANEQILMDVLYGNYFFEYSDNEVLVERIQAIYQKYCMNDELRVLKDMLARVKNASVIDSLQKYLDELHATFESSHSDEITSSDVIYEKPGDQSFTEEQTSKDGIIQRIINSAAKSHTKLSDRIKGIVIDKPEDFIGFLDRYTQLDHTVVERDMIHCLSALIHETNSSKVEDLHKQLDMLCSVYADRFGSMWIIEDNITNGSYCLYQTDEFKAGDLIQSQKNQAFINEMHQFVDAMVIAYQGYTTDMISMEDILKQFQISELGDSTNTSDRLISVIIGKLTANQKFLDEIICNYIGSMYESQTLRDQINHCVAIVNLKGESGDMLEFFLKNEDKIKALDTYQFDESLAMKAERDFIDSISTYLDNLKAIYTAYDFNCVQLQDAIKIKHMHSFVNNWINNQDKIREQFSKITLEDKADSADILRHVGVYHQEDFGNLNDAIRQYIVSLWTAIEKTVPKDSLVRIKFRIAMPDDQCLKDILKGVSSEYSEDLHAANDTVESTETSNSSDNSVSSDTLIGEYNGEDEDLSIFRSYLQFANNANVRTSDGAKFSEALYRHLTTTSVKDTLDYFMDSLNLKNIISRPTDITGSLDDLDQKTFLQRFSTLHQFAEFLGKVAEEWHIAKSSTIQVIMDEMINHRFHFQINDLLKKYHDSFTVGSEISAVIGDEIKAFDLMYETTARILINTLSSASPMIMDDVKGLLLVEVSPIRVDDLTGQMTELKETSESAQKKDEHRIIDTLSTAQTGSGTDVSSIKEQIHLINQKLRLMSVIGQVAEIFALVSQQYYATDLAAAIERFSVIESQFTEPVEDGHMLADVLLGANQIILRNPLHMKDGLYEFTPTGLRRVN